MENYQTNWTKEDLKAYILIYCAHADFNESSEERELINSKIDKDVSLKMHLEFKDDNDIRSIRKIKSTLERLNYKELERQKLLEEMKQLFHADGKFDILERNLFRGLSRILG